MEAIKEIIESLEIPEKKKAFNERRELISRIKFTMSELEKNRMVALYAYNLENIPLEQDEIKRKKLALANAMLLHREPDVETYESLRKDLTKTDTVAEEYYKSIQKDLREELLDLKLPEIYIYQGLLDVGNFVVCRHIIVPNTIQTVESDKEVERVIYPIKPMESKNKLNGFYNRTSFRYLEAMTEDYSFSLEGKNLGRIK